MIQATPQNIARDLYLKGETTQTAIASQLGVHPKTISYWIRQNNWKEIKETISLAPIIIRQNLYTQLEAFSEYIITREDGNPFPDSREVMIQYKLVSAIFKFPNYSFEEMMEIYKYLAVNEDGALSKKELDNNFSKKDKEKDKYIDNQLIEENEKDKEGIKKDKDSSPATAEMQAQIPNEEPLNNAYTPKKNIVLPVQEPGG